MFQEFGLVVLIITGFVAGVISGMTGASGVMIVIPILATVFGLPIYVAIGTSLMADVIQSIPISYAYYRAKNLALREGLWVGLGSILGVQVGAHEVSIFPEELLLLGLVLAMAFLGIKMWRQRHKRPEDLANARQLPMPHILKTDHGRIGVALVLGFLLGLMTGFFGAGGGILIFMVLYFVLNVSLKASIGTGAFVMIITAASGFTGYYLEGNVNILIGAIIGASAAVGGYSSAYIANRIGDQILSKVIGAAFIIIALIIFAIRFAL